MSIAGSAVSTNEFFISSCFDGCFRWFEMMLTEDPRPNRRHTSPMILTMFSLANPVFVADITSESITTNTSANVSNQCPKEFYDFNFNQKTRFNF